MSGLKTICMMQLKDKIDFSYLKSTKKTIYKVILSLLKFAIFTTLIYIGFYFLSFLKLVSILPGIPQNFFSVLMTIMILLSIVVCTFGLVKTLYFSKDNSVLLTMPLSRTYIFISKLVVYYIYELLKNIYYFLPVLLAYGIINKMPFYYYFWILIATLILTALIVSIGALLSIPALLIVNVIKSSKILEYILLIITIGAVCVGLILLINLIPSNFDLIGTWGTTFWQIQTFMSKFNTIFLPITWVIVSITGTRYGISNIMFNGKQSWCILGVIGAIVIVLALTFVLVKPIYFRLISSPFEYKKSKVKKAHVNQKHSAFISTVNKDLILSYRTPEKFYMLIGLAIGMPIAIFLLNKIYSAMDTRLSGTNMSVAFNMLIILLIMLSSSVSIAHVYSEEGGASYLLKTSPKSNLNVLLSKLFINIALMTISLICTTVIFANFLHLSAINAIIAMLCIYALYLGHLLNSAELDIMNPQVSRYQTEGVSINNPNDVKSTIYAFLISAIFAFGTYFFISENFNLVWIRLLVFASMYLALRIWLFVNKVKVYFKEKFL